MKRLKKKKNPYLLYVGNAYPHKNLKRLLEAFKIVSSKFPDLSLVLVGKIDYFYQKIKKEAKKLKLNNKVEFTGELTNDELKGIYENGLAYVFPSLSEGFGLPGLEAMKRKLPVISSNQGPLPEIYGQAAVYFNPKNIQEMAEIIQKVIFQHVLRERLKVLGQNQVKNYSWKKCARQTLKIYQKVLEQ